MKKLLTLFALATVANASARKLEITVADIRSDRGSILVMATLPGEEKPRYAMAQAKTGSVTVTLVGLEADAADVSLFHDENGDFKMDMGERGPTEGYATRKCKLRAEENAVTLKLFYPVAK